MDGRGDEVGQFSGVPLSDKAQTHGPLNTVPHPMAFFFFFFCWLFFSLFFFLSLSLSFSRLLRRPAFSKLEYQQEGLCHY